MRDLYRLLDLEPSATAEEVAARLADPPPGAPVEEARGVLLDAERRAAYDRDHTTLRALARVRARLDLEAGERWRAPREGGFTIGPAEARGLRADTRERVARVTDELDRRERRLEWRARLTPASLVELLGVLGIVLGGVLLWRLDRRPDIEEGFRRHGVGSGEVEGAQVRPWGVADPRPVPAVPLPPTGVLARRPGPLEGGVRVTLAPRIGAPHALVRLVALDDGHLELVALVRSGERLEVELPPGEYDLRYALGETWYGRSELFGARTTFGAALEAVDTRVLAPGAVLEFPAVVAGEIAERPLSRREF